MPTHSTSVTGLHVHVPLTNVIQFQHSNAQRSGEVLQGVDALLTVLNNVHTCCRL